MHKSILNSTTKCKTKKFDENNFSSWELKMKKKIRKDNCVDVILERPMDIMVQKWKENCDNIIVNLHLIMTYAILFSIMEKTKAKEIWEFS